MCFLLSIFPQEHSVLPSVLPSRFKGWPCLCAEQDMVTPLHFLWCHRLKGATENICFHERRPVLICVQLPALVAVPPLHLKDCTFPLRPHQKSHFSILLEEPQALVQLPRWDWSRQSLNYAHWSRRDHNSLLGTGLWFDFSYRHDNSLKPSSVGFSAAEHFTDTWNISQHSFPFRKLLHTRGFPVLLFS